MKIFRLMMIFCLLTSFSILSVDAQWKFTPKAGVTITKNKYYNAGVGAKIGVGARYSFNGQDNGFGIRTGLYYLQRNTETFAGGLWGKIPGLGGISTVPVFPGDNSLIKIPDNMPVESVSFDRYRERRDYLQLPVMAQMAWKITPDIRFHVAAGPYVALGISGKKKHSSTSWDINSKTLKDENDSKNPFFSDRFDAGVSVQTGFEVMRVAILLNYETNLYKRKAFGSENIVSLGIGYTF